MLQFILLNTGGHRRSSPCTSERTNS